MQFAGMQMGGFSGCVHNGFWGKDLSCLDEQEKNSNIFPTLIYLHFNSFLITTLVNELMDKAF